MADFFAARDAIKARIEEKLGDQIKKIQFSESIDFTKERSQTANAVHIIFSGYLTSGVRSDKHRYRIKLPQTWTVVLVYRNARGDYQPGELLDRLISILNGYKWSPDALAFDLAPPTFSPSYKPGVAYYPLAFTTDVINEKEPD